MDVQSQVEREVAVEVTRCRDGGWEDWVDVCTLFSAWALMVELSLSLFAFLSSFSDARADISRALFRALFQAVAG
jgi:hypothetical protein